MYSVEISVSFSYKNHVKSDVSRRIFWIRRVRVRRPLQKAVYSNRSDLTQINGARFWLLHCAIFKLEVRYKYTFNDIRRTHQIVFSVYNTAVVTTFSNSMISVFITTIIKHFRFYSQQLRAWYDVCFVLRHFQCYSNTIQTKYIQNTIFKY